MMVKIGVKLGSVSFLDFCTISGFQILGFLILKIPLKTGRKVSSEGKTKSFISYLMYEYGGRFRRRE